MLAICQVRPEYLFGQSPCLAVCGRSRYCALEIRLDRLIVHQVPCYHLDRNVAKFIHQYMRRFPIQLQSERFSKIIDEMCDLWLLLLPEIICIGWKALYACGHAGYCQPLLPWFSSYVGIGMFETFRVVRHRLIEANITMQLPIADQRGKTIHFPLRFPCS